MFFGHRSPVLLVALVGRILLDIALAALLTEMALTESILLVDRGVVGDFGTRGRTLGASVGGGDRG
jgi:hypothetical protein